MRLAELGRAAQQLLRLARRGRRARAGNRELRLLRRPRACRGWAIELVLLAALLAVPRRQRSTCSRAAAAATSRCRRRCAATAAALGFWLWVAVAVRALRAARRLADRRRAVPLPPGAAPATDWPVLGAASALAFLRRARLAGRPRTARAARGRSRRRRSSRATTAALLALARRRAARRRDQSLRADLPAALAARLALAAARAHGAPIWTRLAVLGRGLPRAAARCSARSRSATGSASTRRGTWRSSTAIGYVKLAAVAIAVGWLGAARPDGGARRRPLRAVPERARATAARAAARGGSRGSCLQ